MTRFQTNLIFLLFFSSLFAGCVNSDNEETQIWTGSVVTTPEYACEVFQSRCDYDTSGDRPVLRLTGMRGDFRDNPGSSLFTIKNIESDIVIEDVQVLGGGLGRFYYYDCDGCRLILRNISIDGKLLNGTSDPDTEFILVYPQRPDIRQYAQIDITIENATVQDIGSPSALKTTGNVVVRNFTYLNGAGGVMVFDPRSVRMDGFSGSVPEGSPFLFQNVSSVHLTNGRVSDSAFGMTVTYLYSGRGDLYMENVTIVDTQHVGLYLYKMKGHMEAMTFRDNAKSWKTVCDPSALCTTGVDLRIRNSTFEGNHYFGLLSGPEDIVDARYNWWGDANGPTIGVQTGIIIGNETGPIHTPHSKGDAVDPYATVYPWLEAPPEEA